MGNTIDIATFLAKLWSGFAVSSVSAIIKYFTVGTGHLTLQKSIGVACSRVFSRLANPTIIANFIQKSLAPATVDKCFSLVGSKDLPGYGEKYDGRSYWLVKPSEMKRVIVYLHGGCYALQLNISMISWFEKFHRFLDDSETGILMVDYTLVPFDVFPRARDDCMNTVKSLINDYPIVDVIGDSAGGALCFQTALHVPEVRKVVMVSPWFDVLIPYSGSVKANENKDFCQKEILNNCGGFYANGSKDPELYMASKFNPQWKTLADKCYVIYGGYEILYDSIVVWLEKMDLDSERVSLQPRGVHIDSFVFDGQLPYEEFIKVPDVQVLRKWLA